VPPLPLASILNTVLPPLSREARAVVEFLACTNGQLPAGDAVVRVLGLRSRHQVARLLRRAGLPPLEELAGWTRVLHWLNEAERTGSSLLQLARDSRLEPATCYRLVRRLTGQPWSRVRPGGVAGVVTRFRSTLNGSSNVPARQVRPSLSPAVTPRPLTPVPAPKPSPVFVRQHPRGLLAARLPMSGYPFDVAIAHDGTAWLTRGHAAVLEHLRLEPLSSVGFIPVGVAPTRVVLAPSGGRAWVTNQFTKDVAVVDLEREFRVAVIPVEGDPLGAVLSPDGRTLYVATNLDQLLVVAIAGDCGRVTRSVRLPHACTELAIHPAGQRIYAPAWRSGVLVELDARTLTLVRRWELGGVPFGTVVSADGLHLYCGNEQGWLDVVHLATGKTTRRPFGTPVEEIALTPDQAFLYLSLRIAGRVAILDAHNLETVNTLETGGLPRHIAFDSIGRLALIANQSGWVDLVR
jgi:lactonase family protein with 7-bladed beta-propeller